MSRADYLTLVNALADGRPVDPTLAAAIVAESGHTVADLRAAVAAEQARRAAAAPAPLEIAAHEAA